jgi:hypothetical protein
MIYAVPLLDRRGFVPRRGKDGRHAVTQIDGEDSVYRASI